MNGANDALMLYVGEMTAVKNPAPVKSQTVVQVSADAISITAPDFTTLRPIQPAMPPFVSSGYVVVTEFFTQILLAALDSTSGK
jgi:hypothetical protein